MEEHDQHNAEFFILPYFSDQQKWIIRQRLAGLSYKAICEAWPFNEPANAGERGFKKNDDNALFHQLEHFPVMQISLCHRNTYRHYHKDLKNELVHIVNIIDKELTSMRNS